MAKKPRSMHVASRRKLILSLVFAVISYNVLTAIFDSRLSYGSSRALAFSIAFSSCAWFNLHTSRAKLFTGLLFCLVGATSMLFTSKAPQAVRPFWVIVFLATAIVSIRIWSAIGQEKKKDEKAHIENTPQG
jgi:hypothetical protein